MNKQKSDANQAPQDKNKIHEQEKVRATFFALLHKLLFPCFLFCCRFSFKLMFMYKVRPYGLPFWGFCELLKFIHF